MKKKEERCVPPYRGVRLYNIIFPIWLLWLVPISWIAVLPANFLIDLLVIVLTMKYLRIPAVRQITKAVIVKVWLFGFAADFAGTIMMCLPLLIDTLLEQRGAYHTPFAQWWYQNMTNAVALNPFENMFSFLWVAGCVFFTAFFIYLFNCRFSLKKTPLRKEEKKKLALSLAVFTAPYLFFLPTLWFY